MNKYYKLLDIPYDASYEEIKQAYRDLVRIWHPDRYAHDPRLQKRANAKLIELNHAYKMLCAITPRTPAEPPVESSAEPIDWSQRIPRVDRQPDPPPPTLDQREPVRGSARWHWYYAMVLLPLITMGTLSLMKVHGGKHQYVSHPFPPPEDYRQNWATSNGNAGSEPTLTPDTLAREIRDTTERGR